MSNSCDPRRRPRAEAPQFEMIGGPLPTVDPGTEQEPAILAVWFWVAMLVLITTTVGLLAV